MSGCGGVDSCLILSTLLMEPKLDCQKLRGSLSKYFIVGSPLTSKVMSENHTRICRQRPVPVSRRWATRTAGSDKAEKAVAGQDKFDLVTAGPDKVE